MLRKAIIGFTMLASLALGSASVFAADPTLHEVYQAAEAGKLAEAQSMMDQVLRDHPNSAKAHYVEAELLAKQGRFASAQAEFGTAERLAPGLPFANPQAVQELRARIAGSHGLGQTVERSIQTPAANGIPWGLVLLVAGGVAFVLAARRMTRRSRRRSRVKNNYHGRRSEGLHTGIALDFHNRRKVPYGSINHSGRGGIY